MRNHFSRHLMGLGQVLILTTSHFGGESRITEQNVVLIVQVKTSSIHVSRPEQGDLAVQGERLGVKQAMLEFENANPSRQQVSIVTATGCLHYERVIPRRNNDGCLHAAISTRAKGGLHCFIRNI